ncbi:LysR substrate-binding domain-containing protein [Roseiarcus fermentans]|uniref:LysR substrate-binding domain-containing protein n=1 Tax=Roseiarcus fermentans TaxID=1473586 RepID=UPI000DEAE697|nr:LysR substrate-binding domain-containing protein [Roseiarcus fermentans]
MGSPGVRRTTLAGVHQAVTVTSPAYLAHRTAPACPEDLRPHDCLRHRLPSGKLYRWEFSRHGEEMIVDVPAGLTLNDNDLMVQAAVDGLGVAYVPQSFAQRELESGRLVLALEDWCPSIPGLAIYYSGVRHVLSTLRAFSDPLKSLNAYIFRRTA